MVQSIQRALIPVIVWLTHFLENLISGIESIKGVLGFHTRKIDMVAMAKESPHWKNINSSDELQCIANGLALMANAGKVSIFEYQEPYQPQPAYEMMLLAAPDWRVRLC